MAMGVRHAFGLTIRPEQMLEFFHDVLPSAPIPFDAMFEMLELDDKGAESEIGFYYTSIINPLENCVRMSVQRFFSLLKQHGDGLIPLDAELGGIEVSGLFTVILLRVKSDHFPSHAGNELPIAHLRYEAGQLQLLNVFESVAKDRRIQISSKR
jgi:hypothetical protein